MKKKNMSRAVTSYNGAWKVKNTTEDACKTTRKMRVKHEAIAEPVFQLFECFFLTF